LVPLIRALQAIFQHEPFLLVGGCPEVVLDFLQVIGVNAFCPPVVAFLLQLTPAVRVKIAVMDIDGFQANRAAAPHACGSDQADVSNQSFRVSKVHGDDPVGPQETAGTGR